MRSALLGVLLVLALGTGVAAQSLSPGATPSDAPDDLVSTVPSRIGDIDFDVEVIPVEMGGNLRWLWRGLLLPFDKDPTDASLVVGSSSDGQSSVGALRLKGVPGEALVEPFVEVEYGVGMAEVIADPTTSVEWTDLDGHRVLAITRTPPADAGPLDPDAVHYSDVWIYPIGEVLYVVYLLDGTQVHIEDVLAELP